jgi:hypothetical protein
MNWSAFFAGAPGGFEQGMGAAQKYQQGQQQYQQNQQMNPLLQQHQQLQNQQMQQSISQGGTNYDRQNNIFAMRPPQMSGQSGGGMPNMDNILAGPQAWGPQQGPQQGPQPGPTGGGYTGPMEGGQYIPGIHSGTSGPQNLGQFSPQQMFGHPAQQNYSPGEAGNRYAPTGVPGASWGSGGWG